MHEYETTKRRKMRNQKRKPYDPCVAKKEEKGTQETINVYNGEQTTKTKMLDYI